MKKGCNNCRALGPVGCLLGYETETKYKYIKFFKYILQYRGPLKQCPKPRTYDGYYLQMKLGK